MADAERQGSIFDEMKARRSRSDDLNARAIDCGLAVHEEESTFAALPVEVESEEEVELSPVLAAEIHDESLVSEYEIQEDDLEEDIPVVEALEADSEFTEEAQEEAEYFSDIDSFKDEAVSEPEAELAEAEPEPEEVESPPVSAEQMIGESEDLLAEEPDFDTEAEVTKVAEELVDRIGPIVDIQSLPKTQPSRVLSKTSKLSPKVEAAAQTKPPVEEEEEAPDKGVDYADTLDEATQLKKKKKKVSLLDSYFKGL